jgi:hypothetical protein
MAYGSMLDRVCGLMLLAVTRFAGGPPLRAETVLRRRKWQPGFHPVARRAGARAASGVVPERGGGNV